MYGCRLCDKKWGTEEELDRHMAKHKREASKKRSLTPRASKRSLSPRTAEKRRRSSGRRPESREEGEIDSLSPPEPRPAKRPYKGSPYPQDGRDPRQPVTSSAKSSASSADKFGCQQCGASFDELDHLNKHLTRQHSVSRSKLLSYSVFPADLRLVI